MTDSTLPQDQSLPRRFTALDGLDDRTVAALMAREHPQTIALVVSHLEDRAGAVLEALPAPLGSEVSRRIEAILPVPEVVVDEVERILTRQIEDRAP